MIAEIPCACGCGKLRPAYGSNGLPRQFISGHNRRKFWGEEATPNRTKTRWLKRHPVWLKNFKKKRYRGRKLRAMQLLGDKYAICGIPYNGKNAPIFEFDHLNPEEKDNGITRIMSNMAWEKVVIELKKCRLLCANCHNLVHGGEW